MRAAGLFLYPTLSARGMGTPRKAPPENPKALRQDPEAMRHSWQTRARLPKPDPNLIKPT